MKRKITVLGGGAMGTGCAIILAEHANHDVRIWMRNSQHAQAMQKKRENERLLPNIKIPDAIQITSDLEAALSDADAIVVAIPSAFLRESFQKMAGFISNQNCPIISVVKGLEIKTHFRPSEIIEDVIGKHPFVALSGPSHAEEFARRLPTSVVAASEDTQLASDVQEMFNTNRFRVYTNSDLIGVELAGALKNVLAIAAGICEGLKYGDNAKSALLTRAQIEMTRFGRAFGAKVETFYGLAGIGDLMTTCFSPHGRNRQVGVLLGQGQTLTEILEGRDSVAEGIKTARSIYELAIEKGIEMPICNEVFHVLFKEKSPTEATNSLMQRPLLSE